MTQELDVSTLAQDAANAPKKALSVAEIVAIGERMRAQAIIVEGIEAQLKAEKEVYNGISEKELPEALQAAGLKDFTLTDGTIIELSDMISAKITEENKPNAFAWLRDNNLADLIKNEVSVVFGCGEDADANQLATLVKTMGEEGKLRFGELSQQANVHHSTLNAFVKQRLEAGEPVPMDLFGVFIRTVARMKAPKKSKTK